MKKFVFIVSFLFLSAAAFAGNKSRIFTESNLTPVFGPSAYFNPATAPAQMDGVIARYYPQLKSKIAFVTPVYQIYWPANGPAGLASKDGKPVDYATWCAQIDYLVEHDWDIVVWMGSTRHEAVAAHLKYVTRYKR